MNIISSRLYTLLHARSVRNCLLISTAIILISALYGIHKSDPSKDQSISEILLSANSMSIFIFGLGMTIFQASEYSKGSMPYILMRIPKRSKVIKYSFLTSVTTSVAYALLANIITIAAVALCLSFPKFDQKVSFDPKITTLTLFGLCVSYLFIGILSFAISDILRSTSAVIFTYVIIYCIVPLSGALVTAINGSLGNALVQYSLASNVEKTMMPDGIDFIKGSMILFGWSAILSILGSINFKRYAPK